MTPSPSSSPWLAPETPDLVWFRGADTIRFLNDLISQEIGTMESGQVARSLLLGPQGKLDHILWVMRGDDEIRLVTDRGRGGDLAATLGRYRIRVDVEIGHTDQPAWIVVGETAVEPGTWSMTDVGLEADVSWPGIQRTLVVGDRPDLEEGDATEYESLRIAAGEPYWGVDVDGKTIPQESGLVESTVDFTKGCYLGQELVARIDSRGHVNRHLRILEIEGTGAEPGMSLEADDKKVGTLTSVSNSIGLALVRRELAPGDLVSVDGFKAVIREIPRKPQT
ncbi:MAG: folate-binding protein YgfZ [Acidobacteria bacterium]|nr:folate-binding protein YgfZ [Acidobacteriota bacterium]TDI55453.1 MAG: folate-binding protein [Acidobacteriota bacterium]